MHAVNKISTYRCRLKRRFLCLDELDKGAQCFRFLRLAAGGAETGGHLSCALKCSV